MAEKSTAEITREFRDAVNMTAAELDKYLKTEDSQSVGITHEGESESVGHQSGESIVKLLHKKQDDYDDYNDDDMAQMKRVISYVHRHLAQKPAKEEIEDSRWRYSLMNWGHDPLKGS